MEYEDSQQQPRKVKIIFIGVEAFRCHYHHSIRSELIAAYDKIVEIRPSDWLTEIRAGFAKRSQRPPDLKHFATYFDDGPAYEFVSLGFEVEIDGDLSCSRLNALLEQ